MYVNVCNLLLSIVQCLEPVMHKCTTVYEIKHVYSPQIIQVQQLALCLLLLPLLSWHFRSVGSHIVVACSSMYEVYVCNLQLLPHPAISRTIFSLRKTKWFTVTCVSAVYQKVYRQVQKKNYYTKSELHGVKDCQINFPTIFHTVSLYGFASCYIVLLYIYATLYIRTILHLPVWV